ncbi:MAG: ATP-binding protein, partial [Phycisphaerae bacterium]
MPERRRQPNAVFRTDTPSLGPLITGWEIVGVALLWGLAATALMTAAGWLTQTLVANGVIAMVVGYLLGGTATAMLALGLVLRRLRTVRRRQNQTLHEWREVQQLFLDNMPQGVFWKDRDCVYLGCNQMFAEMAGRDRPAEVVGLTDDDLPWPPEQTAFFRQVDCEVMESDQPQLNVIEPLTDSQGRPHWHQVNKVPLHDLDGRVVGVLGTYQDITDYKLLEERTYQSEKLRSIGQLAGGVAHDFNNMLTGILGAAQLLEMSLPDAEADTVHSIHLITDTARRAGELTQQLLAFSRKAKTQSVPVDMNFVLEQCAAILKHTLDRSISLEVGFSPEPAVVRGDPSHLQNAVLNLAVNARDAMPEGGNLRLANARVVLDSEFCGTQSADLEPGEYVQTTVTDTGVGMNPEILGHVFEPFFSTKGPGGGTGLGLAAVYGTIRDHRGVCTVQSEEGRGSVFNLFLPFCEECAPSQQVRVESSLYGEGRLLLVDDEEIIRATTRSMLEQLGYEVQVAADGREAVERFREAEE